MHTDIVSDVISGLAMLVALAAYISSRRTAREVEKQKYYSDLDALYLKILELAVIHPSLVDPARTADYQEQFAGDELQRYNAYAFAVWNVCETVYDTCDGDDALWRTWVPAIDAAKALHGQWLVNNQTKFKQNFLNYMDVV